ncbi:hypothetical protein Buap_3620 [Buchnera aphidicola str. APS (Acyrthosiphon pisum)]
MSHAVDMPFKLQRPVYIAHDENIYLFSLKSMNRRKLNDLKNKIIEFLRINNSIY